MKTIILAKEKKCLVDDEDYGWLMEWKWYAGDDGSGGLYVKRGQIENKKLKMIFMHRQIVHAPHGMIVDHINGTTFTYKHRNGSITLGARQAIRGKNTYWQAIVPKRNERTKPKYIGYFKSKEEAGIAVQNYLQGICREYAI